MMPKRAADGTNLRFRVTPAAIEPLENRTLLSNTWFVATNGNDSSPGTLQQPYKTIQAAANVAQWGDTVEIEGGTYRETVHPAHSGVTFTNYKGQTVTIAGTDQITGWSSNGGAIYKASMGWDLGEGNNQVFVDGQMVNEARWPNSSPDLLHPTEATVGAYANGVLYDQSITQGNGFWAGATITITPGDAWVAYTGVVNNSGPGWLQISLPNSGISQVETPVAGNSYFLSGKFQALDSAGEWYRDASGTLYLWDPASDNPAGHDIEVKHRQYGFDLSGVANTMIQGINLFACTIHTDWASSGTVINSITAAYVTQFNNLWGNGWAPPGPYGIELQGANSILENSTIAFSAGDGVYVNAPNVRVTGNVIHDVDSSGTDAAGIRILGTNAMIDHNTIYNTGRDGINLEAAPAQVLNNVVHDFLLLTYDGAGIYTQRLNGQGSAIAYNTVYNAHKNNYEGLDACGIMLDNDASGFSIHDNVTANVDAGLKANNTSYNEQIYNNLFGATQYTIESNAWTGYAYNWSGTQLYSNVFYNSNLKLGTNVAQWSNVFASGSPPLNVPATAGSAIPTPEPTTPPATSSGGSVGATSGSGSAA
ncbi:MAG TPA: right-handed parallel beta-helix repeat-containing protein, partial [Tepidisphaeraceae bacterium]